MAIRIRPHIGLLGTLYLVVGVFVAWNRGYLTSDLLRRIAGALLAILLWFLVLLGADLHIHG
ncbi:hypothetical protein [Actinomadura rupiterrae]|uniref:hypothetical protein n=1 Tax=Actinomadura rupiterrae TaxID=559627 RepID=UPI0020A2CC8A|nr:hypothetical protein [Actinomadura rupiterrae]MCP2340041.1 hypothetical protein [Actinomadura rupiterrae]